MKLDLKELIKKLISVDDIPSSKFNYGVAWQVMNHKAKRIGNMVFYSAELSAGYSAGSRYTAATIDADIRPDDSYMLSCLLVNGSWVPYGTASVVIDTGGEIRICPATGNTGYFLITGWWHI